MEESVDFANTSLIAGSISDSATAPEGAPDIEKSVCFANTKLKERAIPDIDEEQKVCRAEDQANDVEDSTAINEGIVREINHLKNEEIANINNSSEEEIKVTTDNVEINFHGKVAINTGKESSIVPELRSEKADASISARLTPGAKTKQLEVGEIHKEIHKIMDALHVPVDEMQHLAAEFEDEDGNIDIGAFHERLKDLERTAIRDAAEEERMETIHSTILENMNSLDMSKDQMNALVAEFEDYEGAIDVEALHSKLCELKDQQTPNNTSNSSRLDTQGGFSLPMHEEGTPAIQTEVDQCEISGGDMSTNYNSQSEEQQKESINAFLTRARNVLQLKDEDVLELINEADAGDGEIDLEFLHAKLDERIRDASRSQKP